MKQKEKRGMKVNCKAREATLGYLKENPQKTSKQGQKKKYKYLSDAERSEIEILHNKGYSTRRIGEVLGRSHNTIAYELRRCPSGYKASLGKQYARTKLKNM